MKIILIIAVIVLFLLLIGYIINQGQSEDTEVLEIDESDIIEYQVLRSWKIPAGGNGMEILVSEESTKEEVLELAENLHSIYKNRDRGHIVIHIFDSRTVWQNFGSLDYPEELYFKHYLVSIIRNPNTGHDQTNWMARYRDH
jgi:hypothetical protein